MVEVEAIQTWALFWIGLDTGAGQSKHVNGWMLTIL